MAQPIKHYFILVLLLLGVFSYTTPIINRVENLHVQRCAATVALLFVAAACDVVCESERAAWVKEPTRMAKRSFSAKSRDGLLALFSSGNWRKLCNEMLSVFRGDVRCFFGRFKKTVATHRLVSAALCVGAINVSFSVLQLVSVKKSDEPKAVASVASDPLPAPEAAVSLPLAVEVVPSVKQIIPQKKNLNHKVAVRRISRNFGIQRDFKKMEKAFYVAPGKGNSPLAAQDVVLPTATCVPRDVLDFSGAGAAGAASGGAGAGFSTPPSQKTVSLESLGAQKVRGCWFISYSDLKSAIEGEFNGQYLPFSKEKGVVLTVEGTPSRRKIGLPSGQVLNEQLWNDLARSSGWPFKPRGSAPRKMAVAGSSEENKAPFKKPLAFRSPFKDASARVNGL